MKIIQFLIMILIFSTLILTSACSSGDNNPQTALLGEWRIERGINPFPPLFASILTFYEDGRLILDGDINNPAEFVVIAPGRIKIT